MEPQGHSLEKKVSSNGKPILRQSESDLQRTEEKDMDDTGQTNKGQQEKMAQEGRVPSEPSSEYEERKSDVRVLDKKTTEEASQGCQSLDSSEHCTSETLTQAENPEISQPSSSSSSENRVSATSLALVSPPEVLSASGNSMNIISEKFSLYQVKREQVVTPSSHGMSAIRNEPTEDASEQIPKTIPGNNQLHVTAVVQSSSSEVSKSLTGMEVLYNTARNTFQIQPQRTISSMDVLYTAATASQLDSGTMNTVPGIDVLYAQTHQQIAAAVPSNDSTSSGLHNTNKISMCNMLPSHQSPAHRAVVTSAAEYSIAETSLQSKVHNVSYDSNTYEKYKQLAADIGVSGSNARFPLPHNSILPNPEASNTRFPLSSNSIHPSSEASNARLSLPSSSILKSSEASKIRFPLPSNSILQSSEPSNGRFSLPSSGILQSSEASSARFGLPSSNILPRSDAHTSTASGYYSPQTVVCSDSGRKTVNTDGKHMVRLVESNSNLGYFGTGLVGERENLASSLHSEGTNCQSEKEYGSVSISLPNINAVPFMDGYNRYQSKVTDESHTQEFTEYHHGDGIGQQQKVTSGIEMGPEQYGFNMQHEKVSNSNVMHMAEVQRFSYHQNGQIGLTHPFDSGKRAPSHLSEFQQRDLSQQHFYPKIINCDSSVMYVRPDMQKCHPQVYQDLMQGSHVGYFQTNSKTNFESPIYPGGHMFGFHQINHETVDPQHISHEKDNFSRLENLEKTPTLNSSQEVHKTNSDVLEKCNETSEKNNFIDDSLSRTKSEQQTSVSRSEHEVLYGCPHPLQSAQLTEAPSVRQPVQLTDSSSLRSYEQLNTTNEHYLQTRSYGEYAIQSQEKDVNAGNANMPDVRSDMSSIKMKINAILESTSLQFEDSVQQKSSIRKKDLLSDSRSVCDSDSLADNNLKINEDDLNDKQTADENPGDILLKRGQSVSNESSDILDNPNDGFKNNSDSLGICSTGPMKHVKKVDKNIGLLNDSENSGNGKKRSKNMKDSENAVAGLSLKLKVKKESSVSDKKTLVAAKVKQSTISLNNEDMILKENIPQYKCDMCQKEFSQLCSFQRHLRFHSGQPLFTCDLCRQGFNDLFSFVDHITEVGSEKLKQLKTIPEFVNSAQKTPSLTNPERSKSKRFSKKKFRRSKRLKRNNKSVVLKGTVNNDNHEAVDDAGDESMDHEDVEQELVNMVDVENTVKAEADGEIRTKNFKCNECGMQFNYARYLSAHLLTHSDQKSFRCEICSKEFSHGHSLNRHRKKVHPKVVVHSCNICGEGFSRFVDLKKHSNCHLADSSLKCKMCNQEFSCQRDLQVHVSSHTGGKAFQCDLCWKQFTQYCTLLRHKRRFDHSGGPPYKCKWCGEGFYEMGKLLSHSRKHMGSGPHKCDVCGKGFATTNNLKVHKSSVHSSEKPFCCDLCGDQFTRVSYLRQHIKTHTGDRPYVCELCGKGFGMQDTLSKHMRTHTGEKPYSCDQCGKQFSLTATLTVHKRTHTGERPYVCDVCGKGFIDNSSWNKHIKHHHKSSGGRETTFDNTTDAREAIQNNYKTYSDNEASISPACLTKNTLADVVKGGQLQLEGQFLTPQMSVNGDTVQCSSSY